MATKKTPLDQHRSGHMIRVPNHHWALLMEQCGETLRPYTVELQIALKEYLIRVGKWREPARE